MAAKGGAGIAVRVARGAPLPPARESLRERPSLRAAGAVQAEEAGGAPGWAAGVAPSEKLWFSAWQVSVAKAVRQMSGKKELYRNT